MSFNLFSKLFIIIDFSNIGYLTISNALQWRLQYKRIVNLTDDVPGVEKIVSYNKPK